MLDFSGGVEASVRARLAIGVRRSGKAMPMPYEWIEIFDEPLPIDVKAEGDAWAQFVIQEVTASVSARGFQLAGPDNAEAKNDCLLEIGPMSEELFFEV
jgi:hypothetical protein